MMVGLPQWRRIGEHVSAELRGLAAQPMAGDALIAVYLRAGH